MSGSRCVLVFRVCRGKFTGVKLLDLLRASDVSKQTCEFSWSSSGIGTFEKTVI